MKVLLLITAFAAAFLFKGAELQARNSETRGLVCYQCTLPVPCYQTTTQECSGREDTCQRVSKKINEYSGPNPNNRFPNTGDQLDTPLLPTMKLHSHPVLSYCHSTTPPDKEGYLYKKGELNTSYQRRWFRLRGNFLFYFERCVDREPLGIIVLEGCSVELCKSDEAFAFAVAFQGPSLRAYKMAAEDQASMEAWIKALTSASFSYLRMLVTDLAQKHEQLCCAHTDNINTISPGIPVPSLGNKLTKNRKILESREPELMKSWPRKLVPGALGQLLVERETEEENFLRLHQKFGEEIEELRRKWHERKRHQPIEDLINFG